MALRRLLLPVAAPLLVAGVLVVGTQLSDDASPLPSRPAMTQRVAVATPERPPEPEPKPPAGPPVDRPRCIASMTLFDMGRQLVGARTLERMTQMYRDDAPAEVAVAHLDGLVDAATRQSPSLMRSQVLAVAADGLARLGRLESARAALATSRTIPPPRPNDFDFHRSRWRAIAATAAARLGDHASATALVADDMEAASVLAQAYAELGELDRARTLLETDGTKTSDLGWRIARSSALAGVGDLPAAFALADHHPPDAAMIRLLIARTLHAQGNTRTVVEVLTAANEMIPAPPEAFTEPDKAGKISRRGTALAVRVAIARLLHEVGETEAAAALRTRALGELRAFGDYMQAIDPWVALIDAMHEAGDREGAWAALPSLEAVGLADVSAVAMTRVRLLTREDKPLEALEVIRGTAGVSNPRAYAWVHARLPRPLDPNVERHLDDALRYHCPDP